VALTPSGMMMFAACRAAAFQDLIMNPDFHGSRFMYFQAQLMAKRNDAFTPP
jgi:hypothetical protein